MHLTRKSGLGTDTTLPSVVVVQSGDLLRWSTLTVPVRQPGIANREDLLAQMPPGKGQPPLNSLCLEAEVWTRGRTHKYLREFPVS